MSVLVPPLSPMLARPIERMPRRGGLSFEAKWDGFRAICFALPGQVYLQSRRGADLSRAFPEIAQAAAELAAVEACVLDGELVVASDAGRLDFELLATRARRSGRRAAAAALAHPAHLIVFDVLQLSDASTLSVPYRQRRALLKDLFARRQLSAPWTLCPATSSPELAQEWLSPEWAAVGVEGVVIKTAGGVYAPGERGWSKLRSRTSHDAVIGAVTGPITMPSTLLLGRWDQAGRLRLAARSTPLPTQLRHQIGGVLPLAAQDHPWRGVTFSAGWGSREPLQHRCVAPRIVVEFEGDAARDSGRWRHAVRVRRLRPDLSPDELPTL
ncbi:ATP-dependent DNA ligase [Streptomyces diacarni]|uniref:ATP-dependent DNA ligase n=1 Tax=Streptomyces diacarni TaxID=2800381 RepID=UPI0033CA3834